MTETIVGAVRKYLRDHGDASVAELAVRTGFRRASVCGAVNYLKKREEVVLVRYEHGSHGPVPIYRHNKPFRDRRYGCRRNRAAVDGVLHRSNRQDTLEALRAELEHRPDQSIREIRAHTGYSECVIRKVFREEPGFTSREVARYSDGRRIRWVRLWSVEA